MSDDFKRVMDEIFNKIHDRDLSLLFQGHNTWWYCELNSVDTLILSGSFSTIGDVIEALKEALEVK